MDRIGFIGLGTMGAPMAGHLIDAGYQVTTSVHRRPPSAELAAKGITQAPTPAAVAAESDIVVIIVSDTPDVEEVLFAVDGIADGLQPGAMVVDMSSISPQATIGFAERITSLGAHYLDAPVSGGEAGALGASLTIMVGGAQADFDRAQPLFEVLGSKSTLIGPVGAGQTCKVANQIVVAGTIQSVAEGLLFASVNGVDPATVREALLGGLATSRILELHGNRMIQRTFDPGFRIELHSKDLELALSGARQLGMSLPVTSIVQQLFNSCIGNNDGGQDHSAVVRAIERMSGAPVAAD